MRDKIDLKTTNPERHEKRKLMGPDLKALFIRVPQHIKKEMHDEATTLGITTGLYVYTMFITRSLKKIEQALGDPENRYRKRHV